MRLETIKTDLLFVNEEFAREEIGDLSEITDNLAELGNVELIWVLPANDEGKYEILRGERKLEAALEINHPELRAIVLDDGPDAVRRTLELLASNKGSKAYTVSENAKLFTKLNILGVSEKKLAKLFGHTETEVAGAIALRRLPKAAHQAANSGALTLMDALAMADFADEPDTIALLLDEAGQNDWAVRRKINEINEKRARAKAMADTLAELAKSDVSVIDKPVGSPEYSKEYPVSLLAGADGDACADPQAYRAEPGYAVFIEPLPTSVTPEVVVVCMDPESAGWTRRGVSHYLQTLTPPEEEAPEAEETTDPEAIAAQARAAAERAEAQAAAAVAAQVERERLEAIKQARLQREADLFGAAPLRRRFLVEKFSVIKEAKRLLHPAIVHSLTDPWLLEHEDPTLMAELAGGDHPTRLLQLSKDRQIRMLVARYLTVLEGHADDAVTHPTDEVAERTIELFTLCKDNGFPLSEHELKLWDELTEQLNAAADAEEVPEPNDETTAGIEVVSDAPVEGGKTDEDATELAEVVAIAHRMDDDSVTDVETEQEEDDEQGVTVAQDAKVVSLDEHRDARVPDTTDETVDGDLVPAAA